MDGRWVEVGDGVLVRRYTELDLSVGLVLGADECLVIDTRGDPVQGAELAAAVRTVTAFPWTVVLTHAHFDHCFGTAAFLPAPVVAHHRCRTVLAETAAEQRREWSQYYRERGQPATAEAIAGTDPVLPDRLVGDRAELVIGGRLVRLAQLGGGHTDHDLVVEVPDAGVVFAGDLVEQGAPPAFEDSCPAHWPAVLDTLLAMGPRVVVPGHGEPVDAAFVATQRDQLTALAALGAEVAGGTLTAAQALARSPYPEQPSRVAFNRVTQKWRNSRK